MGRPFSLKLTEQEKQELMQAALKRGMSMEEFVNYALAELLEHNATGVYSVTNEDGSKGNAGGHGAALWLYNQEPNMEIEIRNGLTSLEELADELGYDLDELVEDK